MTHSLSRTVLAATLGLAAIGAAPPPEDLQTISITLKDHHFTPAEIHVPSGKPFFVVVTNADDAAEEFEMLLPPLERVIQPGEQGKVRIRPLGQGRFPFFGESNPDSAKGAFVSE